MLTFYAAALKSGAGDSQQNDEVAARRIPTFGGILRHVVGIGPIGMRERLHS
jgi:hypothetical protein